MRPDMLSLLLFDPDYVGRLIEIGQADTEQRADELDAFFAGELGSRQNRHP